MACIIQQICMGNKVHREEKPRALNERGGDCENEAQTSENSRKISGIAGTGLQTDKVGW